ncbi:MAG: thioredoxin domain-containing protein [Longimicrobiales bacterium]
MGLLNAVRGRRRRPVRRPAWMRRLGRVVAGLACVGTAAWSAAPSGLTAQDVNLASVGYVIGSDTAPVTVIEFGDYACSACAEFHRDSWPQLERELVEAGVVVWRHVPFLLGFRRGKQGAKAAHCAADQGAFWAMHDRLFRDQDHWTDDDTDERLLGYAVGLGLDPAAFEECYDDGHADDRIDHANDAAKELGIRVTPVFFIDGRQYQGALPAPMFLDLVRQARDARSPS